MKTTDLKHTPYIEEFPNPAQGLFTVLHFQQEACVAIQQDHWLNYLPRKSILKFSITFKLLHFSFYMPFENKKKKSRKQMKINHKFFYNCIQMRILMSTQNPMY